MPLFVFVIVSPCEVRAVMRLRLRFCDWLLRLRPRRETLWHRDVGIVEAHLDKLFDEATNAPLVLAIVQEALVGDAPDRDSSSGLDPCHYIPREHAAFTYAAFRDDVVEKILRRGRVGPLTQTRSSRAVSWRSVLLTAMIRASFMFRQILHAPLANVKEKLYASVVTFGLRLAAFRVKRKLSQRKLGELAGIHPAQVSHYERGARRPGVTNLAALARALGCTVDELLR